MTQAEPVSEVLLDYRYAFGGHYTPEVHEVGNDTLDVASRTLYYPDNPVGRGWLPKRADYKQVPDEVAKHLKPDLNAITRLPAPQLEGPDWRVTSPFDRPAPASFGPIAPWWEPWVSSIKAPSTTTGEPSAYPTGPKISTTAFTTAPRRIWSRPGYLRG